MITHPEEQMYSWLFVTFSMRHGGTHRRKGCRLGADHEARPWRRDKRRACGCHGGEPCHQPTP